MATSNEITFEIKCRPSTPNFYIGTYDKQQLRNSDGSCYWLIYNDQLMSTAPACPLDIPASRVYHNTDAIEGDVVSPYTSSIADEHAASYSNFYYYDGL